MIGNVTFNRQKGNLNRPLAGRDHISGLLFYGNKPAEFGAGNVEKVYSPKEAEDLGITVAGYDIEHYHISEFFRINPKGELWIGIYADPGVGMYDFSEVLAMQRFTEGEMRQLGVYAPIETPFAEAHVSALQGHCDTLAGEYKPLSVVLSAQLANDEDLTALPDLLAGDNNYISVEIGQDGSGTGKDLYDTNAQPIGMIGAVIGTISIAAVNESIAWVGKFNLAEGKELEVPSFSNGELIKSKTPSELDAISDKGYIFPIKRRVSGTFMSGQQTASNGDYNTIALNRAFDKATRGIDRALAPLIESPVYVDPDSGKLSKDTIAAFEAQANKPLTNMERSGELSGYRVFIDPDQNILNTSELVISIAQLGVGVAKSIKVNIGYTTKL